MSGVSHDPVTLPGGPWQDGWALERNHTIESEVDGHYPDGRKRFNTTRSPLGQLIYRLKNSGAKSVAGDIADCAADFLRQIGWTVDLLVPMPSSKERQSYQPVDEIAKATALRLGCPVALDAIKKRKSTAELKDVDNYEERLKILNGAFEARPDAVTGKHIVLIDDLYRSGATARAAAEALLAAGAASVRLLTMTKTRTRT